MREKLFKIRKHDCLYNSYKVTPTIIILCFNKNIIVKSFRLVVLDHKTVLQALLNKQHLMRTTFNCGLRMIL